MKLITLACHHTFRVEGKASFGIVTDAFTMQVTLNEVDKSTLYKLARDESRLRVKHLKESFKMTTELSCKVVKVEDLDSSTFLKIS